MARNSLCSRFGAAPRTLHASASVATVDDLRFLKHQIADPARRLPCASSPERHGTGVPSPPRSITRLQACTPYKRCNAGLAITFVASKMPAFDASGNRQRRRRCHRRFERTCHMGTDERALFACHDGRLRRLRDQRLRGPRKRALLARTPRRVWLALPGTTCMPP